MDWVAFHNSRASSGLISPSLSSRFQPSPFPVQLNILRSGVVRNRLVVWCSLGSKGDGSLNANGLPFTPNKLFMQEAIGAEYGEGFETFRADGLFKVDVVMYRPLKDLNGIPGAKNLVVCLTGYQRQDRDDIMTMVGLMGAEFSKPLVASKVTNLICYKFAAIDNTKNAEENFHTTIVVNDP